MMEYLRLTFIALILILSLPIIAGYLTAPNTVEDSSKSASDIGPRNNITVVTGQGFQFNQKSNSLTAIAPNGSIFYQETEYRGYLDVDPVADRELTVLVTAFKRISAEECNTQVRLLPNPGCLQNFVLLINLSTGKHEALYKWTAPEWGDQKMHDVDMIGPNRLLIGDLSQDRVYIVNTSTNLVEWQWDIESDYPRAGGGPYPRTWTHVNDVETTEQGWVMVSLRNQDQVAFVDPRTGFVEEWTLGSEDQYDILHRQHNPDYIPRKNGGPSVIVADSRNDRIIEYQRIDDRWVESWVWQDSRLNWPRDADRLPNGNTLIVDSNGERLIEINKSGDIVWQIRGESFYDAERLGTGDESSNGPSAMLAGLKSRRVQSGDSDGYGIVTSLPPSVRRGLHFIFPQWMFWKPVFAALGIIFVSITWLIFEAYNSKLVIRSPIVYKNT